MRKIFIDCGAWNGLSVKFFMDNIPGWKEYEMYVFECNEKLLENIEKLKKEYDADNMTIINKAVWVNDDHIEFYLGGVGFSESSSLIKEKKTGNIDVGHPVRDPCVDLSKWITDNFDIDDYILLKMNIEGAEYPVLRKMVNNNSIKYINNLYAAWHHKKIGMGKRHH